MSKNLPHQKAVLVLVQIICIHSQVLLNSKTIIMLHLKWKLHLVEMRPFKPLTIMSCYNTTILHKYNSSATSLNSGSEQTQL